MLIGIAGAKQHGKDTFADFICKYNPEFKKTAFALKLKLLASKIFGLRLELFNNPRLKDKPFSHDPIDMDTFLPAMEVFTGLSMSREGLTAFNPRQVLQQFGSTYCKKYYPNYWIDSVFNSYKEGDNLIISDVRFPDELASIKSRGGIIIKIIRTDIKCDDSHISESYIEDLPSDITIRVKTGELGLLKDKAKSIFNLGKELHLDKCNYP